MATKLKMIIQTLFFTTKQNKQNPPIRDFLFRFMKLCEIFFFVLLLWMFRVTKDSSHKLQYFVIGSLLINCCLNSCFRVFIF